MAQINFTKKNLDALVPTDKEQLFFDGKNSSFGAILYPSGGISFFIIYGPREKRKRLIIGRYGKLSIEEARVEARKKQTLVDRGEDPSRRAQRPKKAQTLGEWCDEYLATVELRKKSVRDDRRYLKRACDELGKDTPLTAVSVSKIQSAFIKQVATGARIGANRWLASVRACLQAAWRADLISSNPAMKVRPNPPGPPRERVLSEDEEKRLREALKNEDQCIQVAFNMLLDTGARLSEVLAAKWEDVDLKTCTWRIPKNKSGRPQVMPLPNRTAELLERSKNKSIYIVEGKAVEDDKPDQPRYDLKRPWANLVEKAELKDVHIHDLRRTFGLRIAKKAGLHVASKLLRHSDIRVTERHYAPLGLDDLRGALE